MFHCICIYHVRIQDRGQLPDFICKIFDKDSKGNSPSSEFKRTIINNLFVKQADGSFRMNLYNNKIVKARSQIELSTYLLHKSMFPSPRLRGLDRNAMQLKAAMMEEVGLNFVDVEKEDELQALAGKQGIPEEIEKAMLDAQAEMKKEIKALSFSSSHATL